MGDPIKVSKRNEFSGEEWYAMSCWIRPRKEKLRGKSIQAVTEMMVNDGVKCSETSVAEMCGLEGVKLAAGQCGRSVA